MTSRWSIRTVTWCKLRIAESVEGFNELLAMLA